MEKPLTRKHIDQTRDDRITFLQSEKIFKNASLEALSKLALSAFHHSDVRDLNDQNEQRVFENINAACRDILIKATKLEPRTSFKRFLAVNQVKGSSLKQIVKALFHGLPNSKGLQRDALIQLRHHMSKEEPSVIHSESTKSQYTIQDHTTESTAGMQQADSDDQRGVEDITPRNRVGEDSTHISFNATPRGDIVQIASETRMTEEISAVESLVELHDDEVVHHGSQHSAISGDLGVNNDHRLHEDSSETTEEISTKSKQSDHDGLEQMRKDIAFLMGRVKSQGAAIKSQGDTIKSQGDTIKSQGDTIKSQGDTIEKLEKLTDSQASTIVKLEEDNQVFKNLFLTSMKILLLSQVVVLFRDAVHEYTERRFGIQQALYQSPLDIRVKMLVNSTSIICTDFIRFLQSDGQRNRNSLAHANILEFLDDFEDIIQTVSGSLSTEQQENADQKNKSEPEGIEDILLLHKIQNTGHSPSTPHIEKEKEKKDFFNKTKNLVKFSSALDKPETKEMIRTLCKILKSQMESGRFTGNNNKVCKAMFLEYLQKHDQQAVNEEAEEL